MMRYVEAPALRTLTSILLVTAACGCSAAERLSKRRELTLPVPELSGFAVRELADGKSELIAVGDEAVELFVFPISAEGPDVGGMRRIALPIEVPEGGSEFEGVTVDADGVVHVVSERGTVASFRLVNGVAFLVRERVIDVPQGHALAARWAADPNARAEGIAKVAGRTFIVKQKEPVALVELEEAGANLRLGAYWEIDGLEDASDLTAGSEGLHVVGARSGMICKLAVPLAGRGGTLDCLERWDLPGVLGEGKVRWEGLALLRDGTWLAGLDRKSVDSPNAAVLGRGR